MFRNLHAKLANAVGASSASARAGLVITTSRTNSVMLGRRFSSKNGANTANANGNTAASADSAVIGYYQGDSPSLERFTATAFALNDKLNNSLFTMLEQANFSGALGEARVLYPPTPDDHPSDAPPLPVRVAVVGLGKRAAAANGTSMSKEAAWQTARKAAATGVKALQGVGAKKIAVEAFADSPRAVAEGATLALYSFDHLKTKASTDSSSSSTQSSSLASEASSTTSSESTTTPDVLLLSRTADPVPASSATPTQGTPLSPDAFKTGRILAQAQNLARHLMEMPANLLTPTIFASTAEREFADLPHVTVTVRDEAWVLKHGMHAFHAVAKGSKEPLRFVEVAYRGRNLLGSDPEQTARVQVNQDEVAVEKREDVIDLVLVGKGVTFDSGGVSIKPAAGMALMRGDMGGAATVLAATHAVARLGLPINLTTLIPLAENMPSGSAVKPGDVVRASNGLTIEIDNTDAEGRLLLADALFYATTHLRPRAIIDVATLTGAIDVALGRQYAGVFATHEALWAKIHKAAQVAGDPVWRMPLDPSYLAAMQSSVADLKNAGDRSAGACTAAAFLYQFLRPALPAKAALAVEPLANGDLPAPCPWAHVDMAGVMHHGKAVDAMNGAGMTGRPTRVLVEVVRGLIEERKVRDE
ncbi:hypothetical protein BCR44DRAFT_24265 [Catenaria anguillulae PL171]|uniref:Cytosol aminopeptidase domain-containing protein n=1 Tax=Catenaria anguillulae PL171 TaxID=765915 RepID=A0A1Y2I5R4_9FUNG|nr:hypothetical protein BCR44DRAFT_24265 [Catenaria anguillulae PL171]